MEEKVERLLDYLDDEYPDANCSLNFENPLQLLIATILSAQCTDKRVNIVTEDLFEKYPDVTAFAEAAREEMEQDIRSTGFYRNKAKGIINSAQKIIEEHDGQVPKNLKELVKLPGVGRKTANVVLGDAFGVPGITVDTHVKRLSRRIGLTSEKSPKKIEFDLMEILPKERWVKFNHQMIHHGRAICNSRTPKCEECGLPDICDYYQANVEEE